MNPFTFFFNQVLYQSRHNFDSEICKFLCSWLRHIVDHLIKCLISIPNILKEYSLKEDQLIAFLTYTWIGFFDYIYHFENSVFKWKGIKIRLSGRVGSRKMGRAQRYTKSWGINKSSSARLPLQYTYSQIHTRYGVIGMKIFIR